MSRLSHFLMVLACTILGLLASTFIVGKMSWTELEQWPLFLAAVAIPSAILVSFATYRGRE